VAGVRVWEYLSDLLCLHDYDLAHREAVTTMKEEDMSNQGTWLMATGYSPVHNYSEDDGPVMIGPFASRERKEQFLERHGRVFRAKGEVYSPDEYDAEVERQAAEGEAQTPGYGPI
jgi:hypothetical protein